MGQATALQAGRCNGILRSAADFLTFPLVAEDSLQNCPGLSFSECSRRMAHGTTPGPGSTASSLGPTVEIIAIMSLQCRGGWRAANQPLMGLRDQRSPSGLPVGE